MRLNKIHLAKDVLHDILNIVLFFVIQPMAVRQSFNIVESTFCTIRFLRTVTELSSIANKQINLVTTSKYSFFF